MILFDIYSAQAMLGQVNYHRRPISVAVNGGTPFGGGNVGDTFA